MLGRKAIKLVTPQIPVGDPVVPSGTKYGPLFDSRHGWVNTDGVFYPCEYGQHDDAAYCILHFGRILRPDEEDIEDISELTDEEETHEAIYGSREVLEDKGWIGIQKAEPYHPHFVRVDDTWYVTADQFIFINDYLAHHNVKDLPIDLRIK